MYETIFILIFIKGFSVYKLYIIWHLIKSNIQWIFEVSPLIISDLGWICMLQKLFENETKKLFNTILVHHEIKAWFKNILLFIFIWLSSVYKLANNTNFFNYVTDHRRLCRSVLNPKCSKSNGNSLATARTAPIQ